MVLVHALLKVSIELVAIYFHSFEIFNIQAGFVNQILLLSNQIIFRMLKKANAFLIILKH
jgi:hypothetical protein